MLHTKNCEYKLHFVFKEKVTYSSIWSVLHFCRLYCLTKIIKTLIKILKPHDIVTQAAFKLVICNTVLTKYNLTKLKDSAPAPLYQPILHVQLLAKLKKKNFLIPVFHVHSFWCPGMSWTALHIPASSLHAGKIHL